MNDRDYILLPVPLEPGEVAMLKLPNRILKDTEAKRLADIIFSWGKDPDARLQVVRRDEKGKFIKKERL